MLNLTDRLQKVAVIGAGGKMGSGISLLLAREITLQKLDPANRNRRYRLVLMDVSNDALQGLQKYLDKQARRFAEKKADQLRKFWPEASAEEIIEQFARTLSSVIEPVDRVEKIGEVYMVFEAILEKFDLKTAVYNTLKAQCPEDTYFFTNTSSIPIDMLADATGLQGRIIGYHFYNPPAVQKLVELIIPENIADDLPVLSEELGKKLGKIIIPSNDVAGFIGNGHFMRDGLYGIEEAQKLMGERSFAESIYIVNRVTQDLLIRPMGIFQLIDYVGLDIFQSILAIMNPHFPEEHLQSDLIDVLVAEGVKGGQYSDGSQKDGFLKYENGRPAGVWNKDSNNYQLFSNCDWLVSARDFIGELPQGHHKWKDLVANAERESLLQKYFNNLANAGSDGAAMARRYLNASKEIGKLLVAGGVARHKNDVNGVLMNGFFHLYGPINDFIK